PPRAALAPLPRRRPGPADPLPAEAHRLDEILPHEFGERVALVVDTRCVTGVAVEHADGDNAALGGDDGRLSQQCPEHRTRGARMRDHARPQRLQSREGGWASAGWAAW